MVWMIVIADTGTGTIARPVALDAIEAFLNPTDPGLRRAARSQCVSAIETSDWMPLAAKLGVTADELDCFCSEVWGADRDVFLAGVLDALRVARVSDRLRFDVKAAEVTHVEFVIEATGVTVVLAAPAKAAAS
jgi:hypothetical protein